MEEFGVVIFWVVSDWIGYKMMWFLVKFGFFFFVGMSLIDKSYLLFF